MKTLLAALVVLAQATATVPAQVDPAEVPNYVVLRPSLASGGAPTAKGLALLKAAGVRTVVDARPEVEAPDAPQQAVAAGLRYVRVPVTAGSLKGEDVDVLQEEIADPAAGPVYLHCASGNRTAGLWALLRAREGASRAQALAEAEKAGLRKGAMRDAVEKLLPAE